MSFVGFVYPLSLLLLQWRWDFGTAPKKVSWRKLPPSTSDAGTDTRGELYRSIGDRVALTRKGGGGRIEARLKWTGHNHHADSNTNWDD